MTRDSKVALLDKSLLPYRRAPSSCHSSSTQSHVSSELRPRGTLHSLLRATHATERLRQSKLKPKLKEETGRFVWYHPPIQHRDWEDEDTINAPTWGYGFYDLLFVALAYKLGSIYEIHLHRREDSVYGFLIFFTILLNFATVWFVQLSFAVRFEYALLTDSLRWLWWRPLVDVFHWFVSSIEFIVIGMAIYFVPFEAVHYLPSSHGDDIGIQDDDQGDNSGFEHKSSGASGIFQRLLLTDDDEFGDTPTKALMEHSVYLGGMQTCTAIYYMIHICRWLEVYYDSSQRKGAQYLAKLKFTQLIVMVLLIALAGTLRCNEIPQLDDDDHQDSHDDKDHHHSRNDKDHASNSAGRSEEIFIISMDSFYFILTTAVSAVLLYRHEASAFAVRCLSVPLDIKDRDVPISITMYIHRIGDFMTLMFGEIVLSLLITVKDLDGGVSNENKIGPFVAFFASITILHFLHFATYPDDPEEHVVKAGIAKGIRYLFTAVYLNAASILVAGASAKYLFKRACADDETKVIANRVYCIALASNLLLGTMMREEHRGGAFRYFWKSAEHRRRQRVIRVADGSQDRNTREEGELRSVEQGSLNEAAISSKARQTQESVWRNAKRRMAFRALAVMVLEQLPVGALLTIAFLPKQRALRPSHTSYLTAAILAVRCCSVFLDEKADNARTLARTTPREATGGAYTAARAAGSESTHELHSGMSTIPDFSTSSIPDFSVPAM